MDDSFAPALITPATEASKRLDASQLKVLNERMPETLSPQRKNAIFWPSNSAYHPEAFRYGNISLPSGPMKSVACLLTHDSQVSKQKAVNAPRQ